MNLINTLLYFAVFKYPLTKEEILKFCQYKTNSVNEDLNDLLAQKQIHKIGGFYLPCDNKNWVERRIKGNKMANKTWSKGRRMAKLLSQFPFVRSVMISGTLAKEYMDKNADIDFFVIMKPGNITISKLFMGVFRRLFASKSFCVNFLIDTNNLFIEKHSVYSATEMVTLVPVIDDNLYDSFVSLNKSWIKNYLPNAEMKPNNAELMQHGKIKRFVEKILSTSLANNFNNYLQGYYLSKLGKGKELHKKSLKSGELDINKGVFKGHNLSYQTTIIDIYQENIKTFCVDKNWKPKHYFYD